MRNIFLKGIFAFSFVAAAFLAEAQTESAGTSRPIVKRPKPINTELSGGFRINTDGWSVFVDRGSIRSSESKLRDQFHDLRIIQLELSEHKDPKETKRSNSDQSTNVGGESSKPFIFGKINNFFALKGGYGIRKMIAGKPEPGTVSIHWVMIGGLSLGMEKPYYVDGYLSENNSGPLVPATFKYSDTTKSSFLTEQYIRGSAGFTKGINEIQFVPGIHAKTALHFDFSTNRRTAMAVEAGINVEYYTRDIVIMANQDKSPLFTNLFASFQFGRRK